MNKFKIILTIMTLLACLILTCCQRFDSASSPTEVPGDLNNDAKLNPTSENNLPSVSESTPKSAPVLEEPVGRLAFTSKCCECNEADIALMIFPGKEVTAISSDQKNSYHLAWSPNGQMLGILSDDVN